MVSRKASRSRDWISDLLSFRGVLALWIFYGIVHATLRLSASRTLTLDDSRASELVQNLAPGYQVRQPPLYEWLLWFAQQLLGTGIESHLLVRYSLIAALGVATYGTARAATNSSRWAAAASLSLLFSYPVGWTFHEWATQTIILCVACMATLHAAILFLKKPAAGQAVWLGLAIALGFYAKFSYPLFLGALLLAAISLPETRTRLRDPRLLISVAIATVLMTPYALWVMAVKGNIISEVSTHMAPETDSRLVRSLLGPLRLLKYMLSFSMPWILFILALAPSAFWRPGKRSGEPGLAEALALRTMLFAALMAAIGISAIGATNIGERYMHPILIIAPVWAFARIARLSSEKDLARRFAVISVGFAFVLLVIRFVGLTDNPLTDRFSRSLFSPYASLVETLRARGVSEGTVISPRIRTSGNLRAFNPDLRVLSRESLRATPPPRRASDDRSCVLLWEQGQDGEAADFAPLQKLKVETLKIERAPPRLFATRGETWFMARLDPKSSVCR